MDHAFVVRCRDSFRERGRQIEEGREIEPALRDHPVEGLPLHKLHGQKADAVGILDRVDGHDVGVVERSHRARLAFEAIEAPGVFRKLRRQHLQRDIPPQLLIGRAPHLPHPAGAEGRGDAVVGEGRADHSASFMSASIISR